MTAALLTRTAELGAAEPLRGVSRGAVRADEPRLRSSGRRRSSRGSRSSARAATSSSRSIAARASSSRTRSPRYSTRSAAPSSRGLEAAELRAESRLLGHLAERGRPSSRISQTELSLHAEGAEAAPCARSSAAARIVVPRSSSYETAAPAHERARRAGIRCDREPCRHGATSAARARRPSSARAFAPPSSRPSTSSRGGSRGVGTGTNVARRRARRRGPPARASTATCAVALKRAPLLHSRHHFHRFGEMGLRAHFL